MGLGVERVLVRGVLKGRVKTDARGRAAKLTEGSRTALICSIRNCDIVYSNKDMILYSLNHVSYLNKEFSSKYIVKTIKWLESFLFL